MSFRLKTILGIAFIEATLLVILIISSLGYLHSAHEDELYKRAYTTAELFAGTAKDAVLTTDLATLQSFVKEVLRNPGIVYARVSGMQGILAEGGDAEMLARTFRADQSFATVRNGVFDANAVIDVADEPFGEVQIGLSVNAALQIIEKARRHAMGIAATELVLVALFSFLLGTYLTRELKTFRGATRRIADGDLNHRIQVHGRDELAQTADAFNLMTEKLQVAFAERDRAQQDLSLLNLELEQRVQQRTAELTALNQQLEHQSLHDGLTNIPNRTLFNDRLEQQLAHSQRTHAPFALAVLDMDRFKEINDIKGHQTGDLVLRAVARRLDDELRQIDTVARMGGDEFALLLPEVADETASRTAADHIITILSRPVDVDGTPLQIGVSLGIALFPLHGSDAQTLMQHADMAMYQAKFTQVGYCLYRSEFDNLDQELHALRDELRKAIDGRELQLHYQPKVDFATSVVTGVEALVRWQHPQRGLLYPDSFIPMAEKTGLIQPLGITVLRLALRQCVLWQQAGLDLCVAVNISSQNLMDESFPQQLAALLEESGAESRWLELEITETGIMTNPLLAVQTVHALGAMGVSIAIDDFGTGYSSMAYLKRLLAAQLKIDKSFITDMTNDDNDAVIVRSTIELGHNLGMHVIAEGVEDATTWSLLKELGCDAGQGFYLSRPVPAAELEIWFEQSRWRPARHSDTGLSESVSI